MDSPPRMKEEEIDQNESIKELNKCIGIYAIMM